jgi:hypothetical protein
MKDRGSGLVETSYETMERVRDAEPPDISTAFVRH